MCTAVNGEIGLPQRQLFTEKRGPFAQIHWDPLKIGYQSSDLTGLDITFLR